MTLLQAQVTPGQSIITPQYRHRNAIEQHEKAIKHHRVAALLHESGDTRQADTHANIAFRHAVSALETGAAAIR